MDDAHLAIRAAPVLPSGQRRTHTALRTASGTEQLDNAAVGHLTRPTSKPASVRVFRVYRAAPVVSYHAQRRGTSYVPLRQGYVLDRQPENGGNRAATCCSSSAAPSMPRPIIEGPVAFLAINISLRGAIRRTCHRRGPPIDGHIRLLPGRTASKGAAIRLLAR